MPFDDLKTNISAITPFASTQEAWFWTLSSAPGKRICARQDILRCLERLYRARRIDLVHARILRLWGERGVAPPRVPGAERSDWQIWTQAINALDGALRARGFVAGPELYTSGHGLFRLTSVTTSGRSNLIAGENFPPSGYAPRQRSHRLPDPDVVPTQKTT
jgi:hypothetical protein